MKYLGSKNRLSKELAPIIQKHIDDGCKGYLEPFVGGANMIDKIKCNVKIGCDNNRYLIALLNALSKGWTPPKYFSEEEYKEVKNNKEKYEDHIVGYYGFCGSFGAKWFGGYAKSFKSDGVTPRNHPLESYNNIIKQQPSLKNVIFKCCDFRKIKNVRNFVIYCDPPYRGTTKYAVDEFPYDEFYDWCREMGKDNVILVSEYSMPDDFECIWQKETKVLIDSNRNSNDKGNNRIEKLFVYKN